MRVAVAEDNADFRESLVLMLRSMGIDVTHAAATGPDLVTGIATAPPDVAVLDIRMPPGGSVEGFRTAERIRRQHPQVGILLLSQYDEIFYAARLLEQIPTGVGYLKKDHADDDELMRTVLTRIADGGVFIDDQLSARIEAASAQHLTGRELDVLRLVATGLSNKAVAAELYMAETTVERHLTNLFQKLRLPSDARHNRRVLAILRWLEAAPP
ncbi:response regulator transcription factor [Dactylosporangium vinaceum]|uniref:Response regulator n=1 Tax=Dactylosporangium vinaceum TaxID=53362 RepID=A0ABV5M916_9ACTN|nr:response regulator transcription factor [Dactylosporangium vinaceum]UAB99483.1 response regulator transcription factor [Dactylosporangium vinaceum]